MSNNLYLMTSQIINDHYVSIKTNIYQDVYYLVLDQQIIIGSSDYSRIFNKFLELSYKLQKEVYFYDKKF